MFVHPLVVGLDPVLGNNIDFPRLHRLDGLLGERFRAHEPLRGQERLDHSLASIAFADTELVLFHLFEKAFTLEVVDHAFAGLEPVETLVGSARDGDVGEFVDPALMPSRCGTFAGLEVVGVVCRSHFDDAGAEIGVGETIVEDDRDLAAHR